MVWDTGLEPVMGNPPVSKTGAYTNSANPTNKNGGSGEVRTHDPLIKSQMLYLLSYGTMVEMTRLELVSKNNTILEISFLPYKFCVYRSIYTLYHIQISRASLCIK